MKSEITPKELYTKLQDDSFRNDSIIVDVRVSGEHKAERIPSTLNIPLERLDDFKDELKQYKHVYVHCETGGRSGDACKKLEDMAIDTWVNVDGGIAEWKLQGLPVITSKKMSMQRQVMLAAGSLVLLGALLSLLVAKNFVFIALFVGAGLVFAGITNNCGMAILLRKAPWNR